MNSNAMPAMLGGVMILIIVAFVLVIVAFTVFVYWKIVSKTGYHGALSLLMLVPIANLILLIVLAFSEWPIQKELKQLRAQLNRPPGV